MAGFWKLTWVEMKVFLREPMGAIGSLVVPVIVFVILGRAFGTARVDAPAIERPPFSVPILAALMIVLSAVMSLIAIMAIYREGGILKRLRATPLSPLTILGAHVVVKLAFTAVSLVLFVLAGRRFFPDAMPASLSVFSLSVLLSTLGILSTGFLVASIVPTARFAQPIGAAIFYPMVALSGLFLPVSQLPQPLRSVAQLLPTTHAVSLMDGAWRGLPWSAMLGDVVVLGVTLTVCAAVSARVFRWE